jgi:hypothetical protein
MSHPRAAIKRSPRQCGEERVSPFGDGRGDSAAATPANLSWEADSEYYANPFLDLVHLHANQAAIALYSLLRFGSIFPNSSAELIFRFIQINPAARCRINPTVLRTR